MASYVKAFVAENVAELRRMNARQLVQQMVALGTPLLPLSHAAAPAATPPQLQCACSRAAEAVAAAAPRRGQRRRGLP